MSKFLTIAAEVAGGVALIATGVGALGGAGLLGESGAAFGASSLGQTLGLVAKVAGVVAGVAGIGARLLANKDTAATPTEWRANPDQGIDLVFGDAYNSGGIVYRQTYGDSNKYEGICTAWSLGPVDSINITYIDGVGRGVVNQIVQIPDLGFIYQNTQVGLCPEPSNLLVGPVDPYGWTAECKLSGKAAIFNTFIYDTKGKNTQTSIPNCGWRGKGLKAWDPRKDDTYTGGSGAQRSGDQSTWAWSNNPFIMALAFLLGWQQNGKLAGGVGIPVASIIVDQFVEGANIADSNGWTLGGTKSTTDDLWDVLVDLLQAGSAEPMRLGGQVGCFVNTPRVRLATVTRDDLAKGPITLPGMTSRRDRINAVSPTYLQETQVVTENSSNDNLVTTTNWAMAPGAPIIVSDYVTADGKQRSKPVAYPLVQCFYGGDARQIAQLARYDIENAREIDGISLPLKLRWMGYKPGDCIGIQLSDAGMSDQDVVIRKRSLDPSSASVTMTLRTETAGKHAFALGQTTTPPAAPSINFWDGTVAAPLAGSWTAQGAQLSNLGSSAPLIVVEGLVDNSTADAVILAYRLSEQILSTSIGTAPGDALSTNTGDTLQVTAPGPWLDAGIFSPSATRMQISQVASEQFYDVSISNRVRGVVGAPLVILAVQAGLMVTPGSLAALISTSAPSGALTITAAADASGTTATISISAHQRIYSDKTVAVNAGAIGGLALNTSFVVFYDDPARAGGAVAYQASVNPDDALITAANPGRHYVGAITTPSTGSSGASAGETASGPGGIRTGGTRPALQ